MTNYEVRVRYRGVVHRALRIMSGIDHEGKTRLESFVRIQCSRLYSPLYLTPLVEDDADCMACIAEDV